MTTFALLFAFAAVAAMALSLLYGLFKLATHEWKAVEQPDPNAPRTREAIKADLLDAARTLHMTHWAGPNHRRFMQDKIDALRRELDEFDDTPEPGRVAGFSGGAS